MPHYLNLNANNCEIPFQRHPDLQSVAKIDVVIEDILHEFETWMLHATLKDSTRQVYKSRLNQYKLFIKSCNISLRSPVSSKQFAMLAESFIATGRNDYNLKSHSLNNFVAMFKMMSNITGHPVSYIEREIVSPSRKILSREEQERFLLLARQSNSRNYLIALLFTQTGIRLGECQKIKVNDLVWEKDIVQIHIANRMHILPDMVAEALQQWLRERAEWRGSQCDYLFFGATGNPLSTTAIDLILRKIGWKSGLVVCCRLLRNTYLQNICNSLPASLTSQK